ncbi:MAG: hypothetical protein WAW00_00190 [Candidatus Moraniibacteriota bacterium]
MHTASSFSFPEKGTKFALFLFFSLLFLSAAVFVFADESASTKNIFQDSDQDGLSNDEEKLYGTDLMTKDSDGDGYGDGIEVESGYDPLKPAPGDKILKEADTVSSAAASGDSENLTQQVSGEIANILKDTDASNKTVSLEDVNTSVQKVLDGSMEEVTLPDVDIKAIKIKKLAKSLKGKDRDERERQDAIEYLTVLSYLVANNAPKSFQTEEELLGVFTGISSDFVGALSSGNIGQIDQLSKQGEKMLGELKDVEVPEKMLDVHVKALKMAEYIMQLKNELKSPQDDPLGQIAVLAKMQGLFGSAQELIGTIHQQLIEYGIEEIPLNL